MLPKELIDFMRSVGVFPIVLTTTDKNGELHTTFITWVYPVDDKTLLALYGNAKRDCSKNTNPLTQKSFKAKI